MTFINGGYGVMLIVFLLLYGFILYQLRKEKEDQEDPIVVARKTTIVGVVLIIPFLLYKFIYNDFEKESYNDFLSLFMLVSILLFVQNTKKFLKHNNMFLRNFAKVGELIMIVSVILIVIAAFTRGEIINSIVEYGSDIVSAVITLYVAIKTIFLSKRFSDSKDFKK